MPFFPMLGKLLLKYAVPAIAEKLVSWGWKKITRKKENEDDRKASDTNP